MRLFVRKAVFFNENWGSRDNAKMVICLREIGFIKRMRWSYYEKAE